MGNSQTSLLQLQPPFRKIKVCFVFIASESKPILETKYFLRPSETLH